MTLNNMFNITFTTLLSTQVQFSTNVALFNTSFVSLLLLLLLLASLVLTFHSKGTTVHKVLGLLLVSIFVVFLWILQTQFLFIYVVYIMAFISAVLMLFLSVVLMLPISTLTAKNIFSPSKTSSILMLSQFSQTSELSTLPITMILLNGFVMLFIIHTLLKFFLHSKKLYTEQFEAFDLSLTPISSSLANILFSHHFNNKNYLGKIYKFLIIITVIFTNEIKYIYLQTRNFFFIALQFLYKTIVIPINLFKVVFDVILQTYLFSSVFLSLSVSFLSKQLTLNFKAAELNNEIVQGIGQLKTLLYGSFSSFLIFSTVVLLVALLGAAVMTRSKR